MARGMNLAIQIGHLGHDPEIRSAQSGDKVANFSLAVSKTWKTREGESQERTQWFHCTAWRGLAEVAERFLHKGDQVCVRGEVWMREYTGRDGALRSSLDLEVSDLTMLGSRREDDGGTGQGAPPRQRQAGPAPGGNGSASTDAGGGVDTDPGPGRDPGQEGADDLPF